MHIECSLVCAHSLGQAEFLEVGCVDSEAGKVINCKRPNAHQGYFYSLLRSEVAGADHISPISGFPSAYGTNGLKPTVICMEVHSLPIIWP